MWIKFDVVVLVVWKVEFGVVGKVGKCGGGWCNFDVGGWVGFIEVGYLFGVIVDEKFF